MTYSKTTWNTGDKITKEKLNNMESGIANALEKPAADGTEGQILARNADGTLVYVNKPADGAKGAKGDKGDQGNPGSKGADGKAAPTITACTINVNGTAITGQLTMSEGEPITITGTYTAA